MWHADGRLAHGSKPAWSLPAVTERRLSPATSIAVSTAASRKADVPKISRHSTRKTCGCLLAALDVHPRVAVQILRHSKIAITMEIYTEVPSAVTREALRKLGQWLDEADK
jgi:integrase